nr:family 1 glycosylhydrolase [Tessaracoccus coleopterorum]
MGRRTPSVWDAFSAEPGRIQDGSTTAVTADHINRVSEDVALMSALGIDAYRFSLGWTRLQPGGSGPLDPAGVAFYDRLLDELLAAGISPFVTITHWDLPVDYTDGWLDRETAYRLGEFAGLVGERFGDRVDAWVTVNEPATVTLNGYALGLHAPGEALLFDALPTVHHQLLGHGLAVRALRAAGVRGEIGITNVHSPCSRRTRPGGRVDDRAVRRDPQPDLRRPCAAGPLPGRPGGARADVRRLRGVPDADLTTMSEPIDFYGLNYYQPLVVAAGAGSGESPDGTSEAMAGLPFRLEQLSGHETTGFGWPIAPEYLGLLLGELRDRYGDALPPVYITESGASFPDEPGADGIVHDSRRVSYLGDHIGAALAAVSPGGVAEGIDLRGYFVWSLLDNWEWAAGFTQRFGLVHVDFATGARTPKMSYRWLQAALRNRHRS